MQQRQKEGGGADNGLIEIPAGKIREYEDIFAALRREVAEETGLTVTEICGEGETVRATGNSYLTQSFSPYLVTQNLSGGYSIILLTFLCRAEGKVVSESDETVNIHWEEAESLRKMLVETPEGFYPMHLNALRKYFAERVG